MRKINVRAQKIDNTILKIYKMVVSTFSVLNKDNRKRFFEKSFLLANVKLDVGLEMLLLTINNTDIDF